MAEKRTPSYQDYEEAQWGIDTARNKFAPWLIVHCRRTETYYDGSDEGVGSLTTSSNLDFNTYLYDMYYDNVLFLCHFEESSASFKASYKMDTDKYYLEDAVWENPSSLTSYLVPSIYSYYYTQGPFVDTPRIDSTNFKFGSSSLFLDLTATEGYAAGTYKSHIEWPVANRLSGSLYDIRSEVDFTQPDPFTVEYWFRLHDQQVFWRTVLMSKGQYIAYNGIPWAWGVYTDSGDASSSFNLRTKLALSFTKASLSGTGTVVDYTFNMAEWYHLAVVKNESREFSVYVNGERQIGPYLAPTTTYLEGPYTSNFYIGGELVDDPWNLPRRNFDLVGNIDELRYTTNVARYTSASFTLATQAFTYKPWHTGFIVFLCTFDHTIGGNVTFHDATGKTIRKNWVTPFAQPADSTDAEWGYSAEFYGNADILYVDSTADFDLSIGDLTVDIRFLLYGSGAYSSSYTPVLMQIGDDSVVGSLRIKLNGDSPANVVVEKYLGGDYSTIMSATTSLTPSSRHTISLTRKDNVWRMFKDGVTVTSVTDTYTLAQGRLNLGNCVAENLGFKGMMDQVRIIKNGAQHVQDYRVANKQFTYRNWSLE